MTDEICFLPSTIRGRSIRVDANGRVSLNDIYRASGRTKNRRPHDWIRLSTTTLLKIETLRRTTGKSRNYAKSEIQSVTYTRIGADGGTYVHPVLALSYAEYLSPALAYEVREVFLRYRAGDAALADNILERASPEDNRRVAIRAMARAGRNDYTAVLKDHGVRGRGYADCTDELYERLLDGNARTLRARWFLPPGTNLRDHFNVDNLSYVMAGESLASERIEHEDSQGNRECQLATGRSAQFIRDAINADRRDRKPKKLR